MKETVVQSFHRLLVRACREGEALANVEQGAYVSKVQDWTDRVVQKTLGSSLHPIEVFLNVVETYTNASTACLQQGKPSLMVYIRRTKGTQGVFDWLSLMDEVSASPSTVHKEGETPVLWKKKVPDAFVYFGDEFVEGMFDTKGPSMVKRVKNLVSQGPGALGKAPICGVCMEEQTTRMQSVFNCTHSMCSQCVANIVHIHRNNARCPLCRKGLTCKIQV